MTNITKELVDTFKNNCRAFNATAEFFNRADEKITSATVEAIVDAINEADAFIYCIDEASVTYKKRVNEPSVRSRLMKNANTDCGKAGCALQSALIDVLDIH